MTEKRKNLIIIIGGLIFVIVYLIITNVNSKNKNDINKSQILLTTNYSMFFTVSNCANRFINVLTSNKSDDIIKLLDNNYKKDNNIDANNLNDYLTLIPFNNVSMKVVKMYEEKINKEITKYYLKGKIIEEIIDEQIIHDDYYLIITIDNNKKLFSVTPYNGQIFMEES